MTRSLGPINSKESEWIKSESKFIKETLRKLAPDLLGDVVENFKKLTPKY